MHQTSPFFLYCKLTSIVLLCLLLASCSGKTGRKGMPPGGPDVTMRESPEFFIQHLKPHNQAMNSWLELAPSIKKSLSYANAKEPTRLAVARPNCKITWGELAYTLQRLQNLLPELDKNPKLFLKHFQWLQIPQGIKYSGYYSPVVRASRKRKVGYTQPIYTLPPELKNSRGKIRFYDRRTIEEKKVLANRGLELAWAADPVDVFFLEIQGSGTLLFEDGTRLKVNYAGQNGHKYKSSGRIMREKGLLERGDIFEQRQWFKKHPDRVREILNENPSYVFFKADGIGPTGAMGYEIDAWRSLATDRSLIPLGSLVAYGVNVPDEEYGYNPLRGIGFAQDVGGAIKENRIDLYCGDDFKANFTASFLDASGPAWILLAK